MRLLIHPHHHEKQNQYYKVTDMWEGVPENCYGGSGIFINEFDLDEYAEDWEIVTDYRFI